MGFAIIRESRWYVEVPGKPRYSARNAGDAVAHVRTYGRELYANFTSKTTKVIGVKTPDGVLEITIVRECNG